jgi:hypothetical protein
MVWLREVHLPRSLCVLYAFSVPGALNVAAA